MTCRKELLDPFTHIIRDNGKLLIILYYTQWSSERQMLLEINYHTCIKNY